MSPLHFKQLISVSFFSLPMQLCSLFSEAGSHSELTFSTTQRNVHLLPGTRWKRAAEPGFATSPKATTTQFSTNVSQLQQKRPSSLFPPLSERTRNREPNSLSSLFLLRGSPKDRGLHICSEPTTSEGNASPRPLFPLINTNSRPRGNSNNCSVWESSIRQGRVYF